MNTTRETLLKRVRDLGDGEAWSEFCADYAPLIFRYARSLGLRRVDAEEIRDECLAVLTRRMPSFEYARHRGRFKTWLYQIVRGKVIDLRRRGSMKRADSELLKSLTDATESADQLFDRLWREHLLAHCLDKACATVSARDARAFRMLLDEQASVTDVCARLGMNANQVYKAKSRLLERVRELMAELNPQ